jgi:hypothetical protein
MSKESKVELKSKVAVAEKVAAEVNAPLHEVQLFSGEAYVCPCDGRVVAIKKPGDKLATVGGEALDAVPECPGVAEKEHGPWPVDKCDLASVMIDKATGRATRRRPG